VQTWGWTVDATIIPRNDLRNGDCGCNSRRLHLKALARFASAFLYQVYEISFTPKDARMKPGALQYFNLLTVIVNI
jgi:hypothetical protein